MTKGKDVLTTGDVARICHVAPRTVSKWFDSGELRGYRIPGSKDRRIPVSELTRFMKAYNMPTTEPVVGKIRVLIADSDNKAVSTLAETLRTRADCEVQTVRSSFEVGAASRKFAPHVLLVSLLTEGIDAMEVCKGIRTDEDLQSIKIIAIANRLSDSESAALLQKGFDGYISDCADVVEVIETVQQATAKLLSTINQ